MKRMKAERMQQQRQQHAVPILHIPHGPPPLDMGSCTSSSCSGCSICEAAEKQQSPSSSMTSVIVENFSSLAVNSSQSLGNGGKPTLNYFIVLKTIRTAVVRFHHHHPLDCNTLGQACYLSRMSLHYIKCR